jgi:hypothetical protein
VNRTDRERKDGFRQEFVKAVVKELGGPSEAVKRLERHCLSPLRIAVEILGGIPAAAPRVGISRQGLDKAVKAGPDQMKGVYLRKISELTKIPLETLMVSEPIGEPRPTRKRKAAQR